VPGLDQYKQRVRQLLGEQRPEEALKLGEVLCKRHPDDADTLLLMASIHASCGALEAVADCCQRALELDAGNQTALYNLGVAAQNLGRLDLAETAYRDLLKRQPNAVTALSNLGALLTERGAVDESARLLEQAVALAPQDALAWFRLGQAAFNRSQAERAIACFRKALTVRPNFHQAAYALAAVLSAVGQYDEALAVYQPLLASQPDNKTLIAAVGSLYEFRGEKQRAHDYLRPWMAQGGSLEIATVYARCVGSDDECQQTVDMLETLLAATVSYPQVQKRDALYALGGLYDRLHDYARAFAAYSRANTLEPHVLDMSSIEREFAELHEDFAASEIRYPGNPSNRPVFIVGMPRSGTTLVEQMLASHSQVHGAGELDDMARLVNQVRRVCGSEKSYLACLPGMDAGILAGLASDYLHKLDTLDARAMRIIDKMPHNFLALGLISVLFPQASVIHCRRDPRDTCLSIYFQHFTGNHPYTSDLYSLGRYYRFYSDLMAHWKVVLPLRMLDIYYEDVIGHPEESARRLVDFCGLDWEPGCLEFHRRRQLVTTPSYNDVRQPLYSRSLGRWKHYSDWIGDLMAGLGADLLH
jgi:tetratricopeptide (TPR) repeat protein